jgi:hypothetical protein
MKPAPRTFICTLLIAVALGFFAPSASAAEIRGRVTNGTTGKPVPGIFVNLLALRGQMVPVRETETDAEGRFRLVVAANPNERFLVQVPFQGVIYTQPAVLTGGDTVTADVEVFDAGARPQDIDLEAHTIFLEPHSDHLRVTEFYALRNGTTPPRTVAPDGGSFRFALPGTVGDLQVSAGKPGGVSLRQAPQATEAKNTYSIDFAFKPGDTEIQISYALPISGTTIDLTLPLLLPTSRRHIAVPRQGVTLEAKNVNEIQQTQAPQVRVFSVATAAPADLPLRLEVDPEALRAASVAPATTPAGPASESQVQIISHPVNRAQAYIVLLLLFILSLGLYYLYSLQPAPSPTDAASSKPGSRSTDN